jgi:Leucine-rich repeat (LRR) protein
MTPDDSAAQSVNDQLPRRASSRRGLVLGVLAAVILAAAWGWTANRRLAAENKAAQALEKLGALVVRDGGSGHVASVNLSTVQTPEALAEAVALLPALSEITSLDASRSAIKDEQMAAVAQLGSLTTLTLNETAIGDAGVAQLRPLANLQSLFLSATPLTDAGTAALASMKSLRVIDLSSTKLTGNFEPILALPQLEWLVLRDVKLADDALPQLEGSASLNRLSLEGSEYSADALAKLQQAQPSLGVDR